MTQRRREGVIFALLLPACGAPSGLSDGGMTDGGALRLSCNPNMSVSALVDVSGLSGATDVTVEFGDTASYGSVTPTLSLVSGAFSASKIIPLFGITPGGTTHARVHGLSSGTEVSVSADLSVACAPLPMDFPRFTVKTDTTEGRGAARYFLVSASNADASASYGVIVDRAGRVLWYHQMGPFSLRADDFELKAPGVFVLYEVRGLRFEEVNLLGEGLPTRWADTSGPLGGDGHDVGFLANGNAVVLGYEDRTVDTTAIGGAPNTVLRGATLDVVDPFGAHLSRWSTLDNVPLAELDKLDPASVLDNSDKIDARFVDFPHANGLSVVDDGAKGGGGVALLSFYFTNSVYKIDLKSGGVLARLGGASSDYAVVGDRLGGFDHQHDPQLLPGGNLLLFDNGLEHRPPRSRAVEYRVDDTPMPNSKKTLTWVWDYPLQNGVSPVGGSATRLSNGETVIAWPLAGLIDEVSSDGKLLLELSCSWTSIYRALPLPLEMTSLYMLP